MSAPSKPARDNRVPRATMLTAIRWMRDEITTGEAQGAIKATSVNATVYRMGIALRQARRCGLLTSQSV